MPTLHEAIAALYARCDSIKDVPGISVLRRRLNDEQPRVALHGCTNNLVGIAAQLAAAEWASPLGLVALERKVYARTCSATIDCVACNGRLWIEAKAIRPFSTASSAWSDLHSQIVRLHACADAHLVGWRRPVLVVVFLAGCSPEVRDALQKLHTIVVKPLHDASPSSETLCLPSAMLQPSACDLAPVVGIGAESTPAALLDTTCLLALVSAACHHAPDHGHLLRWASGNEHWSQSLADESQAPLLPSLLAALSEYKRWLICETEASRLLALLQMAGGPGEHRRWKELLNGGHVELVPIPNLLELEVIRCEDTSKVGCRVRARLAPGTAKLARLRRALDERRLRLTPTQKAVLLTAASHEAVLFTANGHLLRRIGPRLTLPHFVHAPRWLTGMGPDDTASFTQCLLPEAKSLLLTQLPSEVLVLIMQLGGSTSFQCCARAALTCKTLYRASCHVARVILTSASDLASPSRQTQLRYWARPAGTAVRKGGDPAQRATWRGLLQRQCSFRTLIIRDAALDDCSIEWLSTHLLPLHPQLATLSIVGRDPSVAANAYIGPYGAEAIGSWLASSSARDVRRFSLCNARVGVSGAKSIAAALQRSFSIEAFCLRRCGLLKSDARTVAHALNGCHSLTSLSLACNRLAPQGAQAIARWLAGSESTRACRCKRLDLSRCAIGSAGCAAICLALSHRRSAMHTSFDAAGGVLRAVSQSFPDAPSQREEGAAIGSAAPVAVLLLGSNEIGRVGALAMCELLRTGALLERVDVSRNGFGTHGLEWLASAMESISMREQLPCLKELVLWPMIDPRLCDQHVDIDFAALAQLNRLPLQANAVWPLPKETLARCLDTSLALWRRVSNS